MLSTSTAHALRAVLVLARLPEGEHLGAAQLAEQIGAPPNYLGKLLQQLGHHGLLTSRRGISGGFRLAKPATELSLFDIAEPLEHISRNTGCVLGQKTCSDSEPCAVHLRMVSVRDEYIAVLRRTSIADLLHEHDQRSH